MIVEFMGCTSAGKTTFAVGVVRRLRAGGMATEDHTSPGSSVALTIRNAIRTPPSLIPVFANWPDCSRVLRAGWTAMGGRSRAPIWRAARFASLIRRMGEHKHREHDNKAIHIVDEGVMGLVDLAFGGPTPPSPAALSPFVELLPPPDVLVWIDAPLDALVERALKRDDRPRELRGASESFLRQRISSARAMFASVAESTQARNRVIHAWNPEQITDELERSIDDLSDRVRNRISCVAS